MIEKLGNTCSLARQKINPVLVAQPIIVYLERDRCVQMTDVLLAI
jgi:hypothetical protein